ncbi:TAT-variant-translocated molybdopterin oxidoreductase, partial [Chryseobacterium sp.]|uniref:TAT-variant-translocated molybdopterin oxidoreductase n=1 Tax=Chryseobacterium sp. TaxID=1871047 RepID=UPI002FC9F9D0
MASNKIQFRSIHELKDPALNGKLAIKEFQEEIPVEDFLDKAESSDASTSRRDFLKLLGFSTAAVTLAACEAPVIKTIPYVVKPHDIIPGVPNYYASTYFDGFDFASVLVKTREGRPIKIDPNPAAGDLGKTNARAQASVLSLYDNDKVKQPKLDGKDETFDKVDDFILKGLNEAQSAGKKIVLLSQSFASPTFKKLFAEFKAKYPTAELVTYDAVPYSAALDAAQEVFGQRALPVYDLKGSELVVAFQADFLGDYNASSLESSYAAARVPGATMMRHIQVESNMSLTGANADSRYRLKPSAVNKTLVEVYNAIVSGISSADKTANEIVKELLAKGNKAVVLADGSKAAHVLAHLINQKLGSVAFTGKANFLKEFDKARFEEFLGWVNGGQVGVLISNNVDPIYSYHKGQDFKKSLAKVPCIVAVADKKNEMYKAAKAVIPVANWLESWGDIEPQTGVYTLMQPTIQKIFKSRQIEESLLVWKNGKNNAANNYYDYLKANASSLLGATSFNKALYNGFIASSNATMLSYAGGNAGQALAELGNFKAADLELVLYTKTSIGDGTQANNPWLQELPDPITRMSWD